MKRRYDLLFRKYFPKKLQPSVLKLITQKYDVISNPETVFPITYKIKDDTWESVLMPEIFHVMKSWNCTAFHGAQFVLELHNAIVCYSADYALVENRCVWDKFGQDNFSKTIPADIGVYGYDNKYIYIRGHKKVQYVEGSCISMLGVHADVWSHFTTQFLPKLYYAEEAGLLSKEDTVILLPEYKDKHILELVSDVLSKYPNLRIIKCNREQKISYKCERLSFIPTASYITNLADYESPFDSVVPQRVLDILKEKVVLPRLSKIDNTKQYPEKLYLVRRSRYRGMNNYEEAEEFFKSKGFVLLEPHKLSLLEKAAYFYNAKEIVGPCSAAWSNVIFCNKAKGLFFNIFARTTDAYSKYLMQLGNVRVLQVTGWDYSSSVHSDYTIPVSRLEAAYNQLISE